MLGDNQHERIARRFNDLKKQVEKENNENRLD
jgi:hypothetical protein